MAARVPAPARFSAASGSSIADGPITIIVLFCLALLIGVLVGVGARSWSRLGGDRADGGYGDDRGGSEPLSAAASELGYRSERGYLEDARRAELALHRVLAAAPGAQLVWENVETGNRGVVWAAAEIARGDGSACRPLERRTLVNEAFRNTSTVACRDANGVWTVPQWRPQ